MATIQKTLAAIRQLQDEELELVGGLAGTTEVRETWRYCRPEGAPETVWLADEVVTTTRPD